MSADVQDLRNLFYAIDNVTKQRDDALEERDKVRAENAALLAALESIACEDLSGYRGWKTAHARGAIAKSRRGEL